MDEPFSVEQQRTAFLRILTSARHALAPAELLEIARHTTRAEIDAISPSFNSTLAPYRRKLTRTGVQYFLRRDDDLDRVYEVDWTAGTWKLVASRIGVISDSCGTVRGTEDDFPPSRFRLMRKVSEDGDRVRFLPIEGED